MTVTDRRPHACPHCRCEHAADDLYAARSVDKSAPFYALVELIDNADHEVAPCGTEAAHRRHLRYGEPACPPCVAAHLAYNATRRKVCA